MQSHADFVFHLDEPREQFRAGRVRLRGWITTQENLSDLRLSGRIERSLKLEERPDVRRAFPNYAFATGFDDEVEPRDLRDEALHFSFNAGGTPNTVIERLPPPPPAPPWPTRVGAQFRRFCALLRLRFARDPRRDESDQLIALFADIFPDAFVVQIGANDGTAGDPLVEGFRTTRWSGLLVEPVPYLYEMLVTRYRDRPGIQMECAAISTRDGEAPLYRLRSIPGQTPEWFNQLASLDREVLLKHRSSIPEIDSLLVEERVPTVRLDTLLARHGISRIDLLVIDAEGHDLEILRTLDLTCFKPTLLMFEHQHLSEDDKQAAYALLKMAGYDFKETPEGDATAWRRLPEQ
jgi:FkbM family methyltransferase